MSWEQPIGLGLASHSSNSITATIGCGICFQNTTHQSSKQMVCCREKHVCTDCFRSLVLTNNISNGNIQGGGGGGGRTTHSRRNPIQPNPNPHTNMYVKRVICLRCPFCRQYVLFDLTYTYKSIKPTGFLSFILTLLHLITIYRTGNIRYYHSYTDYLVYASILFYDLHCIFSNNSREKWVVSTIIQIVSICCLCIPHPMEPLYFSFLIMYTALLGLGVLMYLAIGVWEFVATHYHYALQTVLEVHMNYDNIRTLTS